MFATRDNEMLVRKCACHAMSGLGYSWETLAISRPIPLTPVPYTPVVAQVPQSLTPGAGTVLAPPQTTIIPVKKPFDWSTFGGNITSLIGTYGTIKTSQAQTASMAREADRQRELAKITGRTAEAQTKAAAMAAHARAGQPQGMGTGTKVAIGAGVAVAAVVAFKAFG